MLPKWKLIQIVCYCSLSQISFFIAVIFSRIDPGNKLVIGCRKASNCVDVQVRHLNYLQHFCLLASSFFGIIFIHFL